jgi:hypothetical protein
MAAQMKRGARRCRLVVALSLLSGLAVPGAMAMLPTASASAATTGGAAGTNGASENCNPADPPQITSPSQLPNAVFGKPYRYQLTATGGTPPYIFSHNGETDAAITPGLAVAPSGLIYGTPVLPYAFSTFVVNLTDADGCSWQGVFAITDGTGTPLDALVIAALDDIELAANLQVVVDEVACDLGLHPRHYQCA